MPGIEDLQNKMSEQSLTNFLNTDSKQIIFGIEAQINNLMGEYEMALRNGEMARAEMLNDKINELDKMKIDIANASVPTKAQDLRQIINEISLGTPPGGDMGSEISRGLYERDPELVKFIQKDQGDLDQMFGGVGVKGYEGGGEASFPDLTGDNKVTQADILKGRGVFAEGDEVSMMMMELEGDQGMPAGDMEGLEELAEISGPETEMLNNIINQIIELIAQGATEEEIIQFLMEQGLDQEDISAVMSMLSQQLTAGEESIDSQLAALG